MSHATPARGTARAPRAPGVRSALRLFLLALVALAGIPTLVRAQDGTVTGRVLSDMGSPIPNAQVIVVGTGRGSLTGQDGSFSIGGVQPGAREIRAQSIGYRASSQTVQLAAGGTARAEFVLRESAIALDEIVVTGRGTGTARRELGASIAGIDVSELESAPVQSMSQLLQGREPGVQIVSTGGQAGQGSRILLRGINTLSQRNQPLVYVDGVRIDNSSYGGVRTTGPGWSGLDDINPNDIARIEVIRGASAATLYGSEAAAGVIQIFTKRGAEGDAVWRSQLRSRRQRHSALPGGGRAPARTAATTCTTSWPARDSREPPALRLRRREGPSYYVSGTLRENGGILPTLRGLPGLPVQPSVRALRGPLAGGQRRILATAGPVPAQWQQPGRDHQQRPGGWPGGELGTAGEPGRAGDGCKNAGTALHGGDHRRPHGERPLLAPRHGGPGRLPRRQRESCPPTWCPAIPAGMPATTGARGQPEPRLRGHLPRGTDGAGALHHLRRLPGLPSETGITDLRRGLPLRGLRVVDATASNYSAGESRGEERSAGFFPRS